MPVCEWATHRFLKMCAYCSLTVSWVRLYTSAAGDVGFIPG